MICGRALGAAEDSGEERMVDWGSVAFAFAAISGGIGWLVLFGYELYTLAPPMHTEEPKEKVHLKKAA
jgi:hypothetical protein